MQDAAPRGRRHHGPPTHQHPCRMSQPTALRHCRARRSGHWQLCWRWLPLPPPPSPAPGLRAAPPADPSSRRPLPDVWTNHGVFLVCDAITLPAECCCTSPDGTSHIPYCRVLPRSRCNAIEELLAVSATDLASSGFARPWRCEVGAPWLRRQSQCSFAGPTVLSRHHGCQMRRRR